MSTSLFFQPSAINGGPLSRAGDDESESSSPLHEHGGLHVAIGPLPRLEQLAFEWRALEPRADASFFMSWSWMGAWVATVPDRAALRLVRVSRGFETVGLAIVSRRRQSWRGPLRRTALTLNATGDVDLDRITIEFNDVLADRPLAAAVRLEVIAALARIGAQWDELHLPGLASAHWGGRPFPRRMAAAVRSEPAFAVDLEAVRAASTEGAVRDRYLGLLSANTRSQVRRSIKEYEQLGPLVLTEASSVEEALEHLGGMRGLHQAYWNERGEPGAFAHAYFEQFHRRLIGDAFARGEIQLLRLSAGESVVGYLYNFVCRGQVLNYQSGFDYRLAGKAARPGLVMHTLAIVSAAERGLFTYDFMAGANRGKESLATVRYTMDWVTLRQPRLSFWIDDRLRDLRRLLRPGSARSQPAA